MNEKSQKIIDLVKELTILELAELVKDFEAEFGVSAAPVAVAGPAVAAAPAAEEKTEFDVELTGFDAAAKLKVIKAVKDMLGLGLAEAKDLVTAAPKVIKSGVSKDEAEAIKKDLVAVGATIEIK